MGHQDFPAFGGFVQGIQEIVRGREGPYDRRVQARFEAQEKVAREEKAEALIPLGIGIGAGGGLASHLRKYLSQRKDWLAGRANPPIRPKSVAIWDYLRRPSVMTPGLARRLMGGAAIGGATAITLNELMKQLKRKKK